MTSLVNHTLKTHIFIGGFVLGFCCFCLFLCFVVHVLSSRGCGGPSPLWWQMRLMFSRICLISFCLSIYTIYYCREEHVQHVHLVLHHLLENKLSVKAEKGVSFFLSLLSRLCDAARTAVAGSCGGWCSRGLAHPIFTQTASALSGVCEFLQCLCMRLQ